MLQASFLDEEIGCAFHRAQIGQNGRVQTVVLKVDVEKFRKNGPAQVFNDKGLANLASTGYDQNSVRVTSLRQALTLS